MAIVYGDAATWIAALVSIYAALVARKASRAADRHQDEAGKQARRAADLTERNHQLELRSWADQYFSGVRAWADQVCFAISEGIHLSDGHDSGDLAKNRVLVRLSYLIDTGRWHFPNQWSEDYGPDKEPAYRGVRQPVLDCVVSAYNAINDSSGPRARKEKLWKIQRKFVSRIQETLDPRSREQEIRKALQEFEDSYRLRTQQQEP